MLSRWLQIVISIIVLPFTVLVAVPWAILQLSNDVCYAWMCTFPLSIVRLVVAGLLLGGGFVLFVWTNILFIRQGDGTLAPWYPAQKLIVEGPYRYMRNPMIGGVLLMLLGEGVLFTSIPIFLWFLAFFVLNAIYLPLSEERGLKNRFGEEFERYLENVPAWIPRDKPRDGTDPIHDHPHFSKRDSHH